MIIRIGTRGSKLALIQAETIKAYLSKQFPEHDITLSIISTKGDRNQELALDQMQDKGIFVKEIEHQLLDGSIDLAVHSMKDMPSILPKGLCLGPVPKAEIANDVIVMKDSQCVLDAFFSGTLGTGSKRRIAQLKQRFPLAKIKGIRGNIDTRIEKMERGEVDGLVLAAAGLVRLGYEERIHTMLEPVDFVPACAQGILAIELREDRMDLWNMLEAIKDDTAKLRSLGERTFLKCVEGGCHIPVGAYVKLDQTSVKIYGMLGNEDGSCMVKGEIAGAKEDVESLAEQLAYDLMKQRDHYG